MQPLFILFASQYNNANIMDILINTFIFGQMCMSMFVRVCCGAGSCCSKYECVNECVILCGSLTYCPRCIFDLCFDLFL